MNFVSNRLDSTVNELGTSLMDPELQIIRL